MKLECLTVREMLQLPILQDATLIGGEQGLDRIVRYVDILEVPDLKGWTREGEMLLTTGYSIQHDPALLKNVVKELVQDNGAALAIKSGRYISQIPQEVIDLCNEYGLPIILLPQGIPYIDITATIMEHILDPQLVMLKKSEEVYKVLLNMILNNSGLQAMADEVAKLLHCSIWVLSNRCGIHISSPYGRSSLPTGKTLDFDIEVDHQSVGKLMVEKEQLSELEQVYVEQVRQIFSLELMRSKIAIDTEIRLKGNFFTELLIGMPHSRQQMEDRGRQLGIRSDWMWEVVMIEADASHLEETSPFVRELNDWVQHDIKHQRGCVWSHIHYTEKHILLLLAYESEVSQHKKKQTGNEEHREWMHLLTTFMSKWNGTRAGLGNRYPLHEVHRSYREAESAVMIGCKLDQHRAVFTYNEVEIIQLLSDSYEQIPISPFIEKNIGKIAKHDEQHGTDFILTLYYYLATEGSLLQTANLLYVHRNSVKYRMDKIKELFEVELDHPLNRLMYYLCTALYIVNK